MLDLLPLSIPIMSEYTYMAECWTCDGCRRTILLQIYRGNQLRWGQKGHVEGEIIEPEELYHKILT